MPDDALHRVESASAPLRVKFGIDPTRDRLHIGHFVPLRLCRQLQDAGHELDIILGTLTAQLGDPSGQDATRPFLDPAAVQANADRLVAGLHQVLRPGFRVHRNDRFLQHKSIDWFLTEIASRTTVAAMLARDGFRRRVANQQPIGLHELLVPLIQGWDSVHVQSEVEVGSTDQLFNFQVARTLQQRHGQPPQVLLMTPLIRGTDGRKMSKSFDNAVWVDERPAEMFGQILSIPDEVMDEWWEVFTDDSVERPEHPRDRKHALAHELVRQLHGPSSAQAAKADFTTRFVERGVPEEVPIVDATDLLALVVRVRGGSRSEARRLIAGGGVRVDDVPVRTPEAEPPSGAVVRVGRRHLVRIR